MVEGARFRAIFERLHTHHPPCLRDEWLGEPCRTADGAPVPRPIAWSRRNGPWSRSPLLWVGAAPGNAGGRGGGDLGAHGTRIPFGGDIGGANLDVLLGTVGLDRNRSFICSAFNQLPLAGGGEPTAAELLAPVGGYANSIASLRDTLIAVGPGLVVALGNVALRAVAAITLESPATARLPAIGRLQKLGVARGMVQPIAELAPVATAFRERWQEAWPDDGLPAVLWLVHPSAQNMSPFAAVDTGFFRRMREAQAALRRASRQVLGWEPPAERPPIPTEGGIYALPEWRERIGPRHADMDRRWREKGV